MKHCILILDGASGLPLDELGGRTCLETAATPNLDRMASAGRSGTALTVPEGMEPSSAAACSSILGFDPAECRIGRGAIEAASMGVQLGEGDVAFRCNLVSVAGGRMDDYSCGHISNRDAHRLIAALQQELGDETTCFYPGLSYRNIVVLGNGAAALGATCTPPHDIPDQPVDDYLPHGPGAELLLAPMRRSVPVLAQHPVNAERVTRGEPAAAMIWLFWGGAKPGAVPAFADRYGIKAAITSAVDLLGGLAAIFDITRLDIKGVTDGPDNDYAAQGKGALAALADHDLVVIHVEAPDEASHAGDAAQKIEAIERIDRDIAARLLEYGSDLRILAMPDHPTPVVKRTHVADPVPFVLFGPGFEPNGAGTFSESEAATTGLFVEHGWELMGMLTGRPAGNTP